MLMFVEILFLLAVFLVALQVESIVLGRSRECFVLDFKGMGLIAVHTRHPRQILS